MQVQEERDINGLKVSTRQLTPMRGYRLMSRLGKLLPSIAKALSPDSLARIKGGDYSAALPVAAAVFGSLDDLDASTLPMEILASTSVFQNGEKGSVRRLDLTKEDMIDAAFEGNLKALLGAMLFALEVNFRDFFPERAPSESATPTPSP